MLFLRKTFCLLTAFTLFFPASALPEGLFEGYVKLQQPDFLTFDELKSLVKNPKPKGLLGMKLAKFWKTPIISNEAYYAGVRPTDLRHPQIGRVMSVASWNVEKSFHVPRMLDFLTSNSEFENMIDLSEVNQGSSLYKKIARQRKRLLESDILILEEMDIGVKRSGYLNAAETIAKALKMNYAYGAQQLEIDPVHLGLEKPMDEEGQPSDEFEVDPALYKGVFGSAVLSRYPIKKVEVFQLKNQGYDWYEGEKPKVSLVEKTRRLGSKLLFWNELTRELKVGGRIYFRVDLEVPELPEKTLTVINIHLEIKCLPAARQRQMEEILSYIKKIKHPVIVMGDFNAASTDISPTSATRVVARTAKNPSTWFNAAVTFLTPYGPVNTVRGISNSARGLQNPLAKHVPIIGPNPVYPLFEMIKEFRFNDGKTFDFRGDSKRSINGKSKTLSNSNHRDFKGFKTTFQVRRPIASIFGKLRLDWVFVKSFLESPQNEFGPYKFAPHFGETLEELNTSLKEPISDHHPNVVLLPFEEPALKN